MTLAQLSIGQHAVVRRINGTDESIIRLMEMGLTPGTVVRVNRVAPLGDPIHVTLRAYNLSIRKAEAERIDVDGPS